MRARWILAPNDPDRAADLGRALGVAPLVAQLLLNRGVDQPERARRWLEPKLADLRRPDEMHGFHRAVERLTAALTGGQIVGVFGDYDVDGVTSCALLTLFLREAGGHVVPRVARRDAGYGFSPDEVTVFAEAGCKLIVTCDLGTSDHEALAAARARGIDVIVVDHHQVPEREPDLLALLNPHQPACRFPFKGLASVGVAFYLAAALRTKLRGMSWPKQPDPRELLDLVAVGTVADMAPLADENRILVAAGLERLRTRPRAGLKALAAIVGLPDGVRRAADIGLRLSPRLNAPGRLGAAQLALDLLLCDDAQQAEALALACDDANAKRQEVQSSVMREAEAQADAQRDEPFVFAVGDGWHPGVVGIVAARLVERCAKPAFVVGMDGDVGRGSARTAHGFNLHAALKECAELLLRWGGHAQAAGLTVERKRLDAVRSRLAAAVLRHNAAPPARELTLDAEVMLHEIDERLCAAIRRLEPFGVGNPEPLLGARGLLLERARIVGNAEAHLQVTLRAGDCSCDGIGFNLAAGAPDSGSRVRAAFFPELDTYKGVTRVRVRLRDLSVDP